MQRTKKPLFGLLALAAIFLFLTPAAMAAGTASGTSIDNTVSIDYTVGTVAQDQITDTYTFVVDTKVNLTVAYVGAAEVDVIPGQTGAMLTFSVTNNGNATQAYTLAAANTTTGTTNPFDGANPDAFDVTTITSVVADNATLGTSDVYDANDTETSITSLAADATRYVYVFSTIPTSNNVDEGDVSVIDLVATTCDDGTTTATTATGDGTAWVDGTVQIVFADGQGTATASDALRDGKHSAASAYIVATAELTVTKSSEVISDGFSATNPKAIPGAIVEYTITIENTGSVGATGLSVSDSLDTEITAGTIAFNTDSYGAGYGIQVNENGGGDVALTNASDSPGTDDGEFSSNTVSVSGLTVNAGATTTVQFRVTIQ